MKQTSPAATKQYLIDSEKRFDDKLEKIFKKYNAEVMNKLDYIVGEIQTMRKENIHN